MLAFAVSECLGIYPDLPQLRQSHSLDSLRIRLLMLDIGKGAWTSSSLHSHLPECCS